MPLYYICGCMHLYIVYAGAIDRVDAIICDCYRQYHFPGIGDIVVLGSVCRQFVLRYHFRLQLDRSSLSQSVSVVAFALATLLDSPLCIGKSTTLVLGNIKQT